jgi:hypothetical protein
VVHRTLAALEALVLRRSCLHCHHEMNGPHRRKKTAPQDFWGSRFRFCGINAA